MKLLIDQDLTYTWTAPSGMTPEDLESELDYYRSLVALTKTYSMTGRSNIGPTSIEIVIYAQNVTVDEIAMNTLFADFLTELFEVETRYAALGGAGCDFALAITKAVPLT